MWTITDKGILNINMNFCKADLKQHVYEKCYHVDIMKIIRKLNMVIDIPVQPLSC